MKAGGSSDQTSGSHSLPRPGSREVPQSTASLCVAWIVWAILVTSDNGAPGGLGVLVAWPALLLGLALISLPLIWAFRVIRGMRPNGDSLAGSDDSRPGGPAEVDDSGGSQEAGAEVTEPR